MWFRGLTYLCELINESSGSPPPPRDPCANEPGDSCPQNPHPPLPCVDYYRRRPHVRMRQPSPRALCRTCGASGDGHDPCGPLNLLCRAECAWVHRDQPGLIPQCQACCDDELQQCLTYTLTQCGCMGHTY